MLFFRRQWRRAMRRCDECLPKQRTTKDDPKARLQSEVGDTPTDRRALACRIPGMG